MHSFISVSINLSLAGLMLTGTVSADNLRDEQSTETSNTETIWKVTFIEEAGLAEKQNQTPTTRTVRGRIITTAEDGGFLLMGQDGRYWPVTPDRLKEKKEIKEEFRFLTAKELAEELKQEFGPEFKVYGTKHYLICANTSENFQRWSGALFERLFEGFHKHWKEQQSLKKELAIPLVAIIFSSQQEFVEYAANELGKDAASTQGYYSSGTNRITLYDQTTIDQTTIQGRRGQLSQAQIHLRMSEASANVATIIHEATHQIAYNAGFHTRYADNPLWLTEGLAMYCEMPDMKNKLGWKTIGKLNTVRLRQFRPFMLKLRPANSLETLLKSNDRFQNAETIGNAYAEAWAFSYFLIRTKRKLYLEYMNSIAAKDPLIWDSPQERLQEFQAVFGEDLEKLDHEFLRFIRRFRVPR